MKRLLRMQAATLFTLMFVIPFVVRLILTIWSDYISTNNAFWSNIIVTTYLVILWFWWIYACGITLNNKRPEAYRGSEITFKVSFVLSVMLTITGVIFSTRLTNETDYGHQQFDLFMIGTILIMAGILPMIYCFYFVAKSLVTAETQQKASFDNVKNDFILVWAWPYGIWFIQPRINKLFEEEEE